MLRGRLPKFVSADRPEDGLAGQMRLDWTDDGIDSDPDDFMVVALAGPLAERAVDWPPAWPLDPDRSSDTRQFYLLARFLDLDETGYSDVRDRAVELSRYEDFSHLVGLVGRALELKDALRDDDLAWLIPDRLLDKYGVKATCST
jgi:hypothetical protein